MKNPIIAASGTFGNGPEYAGYLDLSNEIGAISVKGLTPKGRHGNPGTRIAETPSGVLNCIGLENPGAEHFVREILPELKKYDVPLLANMSAGTIDEFAWMAETLSVDGIAGLEVNVSCPNVECEGMAFGVDPKVVESVTKAVRKVTDKPVIVKLSPNVTDIVEIAKAVEAGGNYSYYWSWWYHDWHRCYRIYDGRGASRSSWYSYDGRSNSNFTYCP